MENVVELHTKYCDISVCAFIIAKDKSARGWANEQEGVGRWAMLPPFLPPHHTSDVNIYLVVLTAFVGQQLMTFL